MGGLFSAAMPIPSHAGLALLAVLIGGAQLALAKGTSAHRLLGWLWVTVMAYVAVSSFLSVRFKRGAGLARFIC